MYSPTTSASPPKMPCKTLVRSCATTSIPMMAPITIPGAHVLRIAQSTAPFLLWLCTDRSEVTMIVANEVARHICISCGLS